MRHYLKLGGHPLTPLPFKTQRHWGARGATPTGRAQPLPFPYALSGIELVQPAPETDLK